MRIKIVRRGLVRFDWEPLPSTSNGTIRTAETLREIGAKAFPEWFCDADLRCYFTREQIDLLAAVLRLNGIEVIER